MIRPGSVNNVCPDVHVQLPPTNGYWSRNQLTYGISTSLSSGTCHRLAN